MSRGHPGGDGGVGHDRQAYSTPSFWISGDTKLKFETPATSGPWLRAHIPEAIFFFFQEGHIFNFMIKTNGKALSFYRNLLYRQDY